MHRSVVNLPVSAHETRRRADEVKRWYLPVVAPVLVAACGGASSSAPPQHFGGPLAHGSVAGPGKYDQTWPQSYANTTCADWLSAMSGHERFVASADMLSGARDKGDGGAGVAPDELVATFEAEMTSTCKVVPTSSITDIAVGLYLTERAKYRP